MTCIVGLADKGKVYIGGDSAGVGGQLNLQLRADEKVFKNGEFIMGFTDSFRMGQLLRFKLNPPKQHPDTDDYEYMVTSFIESLRTCLKDGGYATINNGEETGGTFLVGYRGHLYEIQSDYQVAKMMDDYSAIGCGYQLALGSLYSSKILPDFSPYERVQLALESSEHLSAGVQGPFEIISMEKKNE